LEAGDTNVYRYVTNDPANRNDPSGYVELDFSLIDKVLVGTMGGFNVHLKWKVKPGADACKGGYIIQQVSRKYSYLNGLTGKELPFKGIYHLYDPLDTLAGEAFPPDDAYPYWEAWRVDPNKTDATQPQKANFDDENFMNSVVVPSAQVIGELQFDYTAVYHDGVDEADLKKAGFKPPTGRSPTGGLWYYRGKAAPELGGKTSDPIERRIISKWSTKPGDVKTTDLQVLVKKGDNWVEIGDKLPPPK
jgi:hypothetical protein